MPAVAVTDTNNMFCALEFSVAASPGFNRLSGVRVDLTYDRAEPGARKGARPLVLLAQNERVMKPDEAQLLSLYRQGRRSCRR